MERSLTGSYSSDANATFIAGYPINDTTPPVNGNVIIYQGGQWIFDDASAIGLTSITNVGTGFALFRDISPPGNANFHTIKSGNTNITFMISADSVVATLSDNPVVSSITLDNIHANLGTEVTCSAVFKVDEIETNTTGTVAINDMLKVNTITNNGAANVEFTDTNFGGRRTSTGTTSFGILSHNSPGSGATSAIGDEDPGFNGWVWIYSYDTKQLNFFQVGAALGKNLDINLQAGKFFFTSTNIVADAVHVQFFVDTVIDSTIELVCDGNARFSKQIRDVSNSAGATFQYLGTDGSSVSWTDLANDSAITSTNLWSALKTYSTFQILARDFLSENKGSLDITTNVYRTIYEVIADNIALDIWISNQDATWPLEQHYKISAINNATNGFWLRVPEADSYTSAIATANIVVLEFNMLGNFAQFRVRLVGSDPIPTYDIYVRIKNLAQVGTLNSVNIAGNVDPPATGIFDCGVDNVFLYRLGDVNIPAPSNNDILLYNGGTGKWVNSPLPATDITIYSGDATVTGNRNVNIGTNNLQFSNGTLQFNTVSTTSLPTTSGYEFNLVTDGSGNCRTYGMSYNWGTLDIPLTTLNSATSPNIAVDFYQADLLSTNSSNMEVYLNYSGTINIASAIWRVNCTWNGPDTGWATLPMQMGNFPFGNAWILQGRCNPGGANPDRMQLRLVQIYETGVVVTIDQAHIRIVRREADAALSAYTLLDQTPYNPGAINYELPLQNMKNQIVYNFTGADITTLGTVNFDYFNGMSLTLAVSINFIYTNDISLDGTVGATFFINGNLLGIGLGTRMPSSAMVINGKDTLTLTEYDLKPGDLIQTGVLVPFPTNNTFAVTFVKTGGGGLLDTVGCQYSITIKENY